MPVLINFKICDNAKECNGIEVCPTGALSWDEKKKKIIIDNSKCMGCKRCEKACMVGAIKVAKTDEEYKRIKKEIDEDPRKVSDLFVDRYGAMPIEPAFLIPKGRFELEVLESNKLVVVEAFSDDSIECLRFSIPIKDLLGDFNIKYRRLKTEKNDPILKRYKVKKLPSLLFFKDGKLRNMIKGYYSSKKKEALTRKIKKIISKMGKE